jgi:cephalosporin-C deacetylase-like acetyl esterase
MSAAKRKSFIRRIIFWLFTITIFGIFVVVAGTWAYLFDHYVHPPRLPLEGTPADAGLEFRDVAFETEEGFVLSGWIVLPPEPLRQEKMPSIIAVHGYGTNRWDIGERIAHFANAGYLVLTYDQRDCGESEGDAVTGGSLEVHDLRRAIDLILRQADTDSSRVTLYGFSMGAVVAIHAADEDERVNGVIADSPYSSMKAITRKILDDRSIPHWPFIDLFAFSYESSFKVSMDEIDTVRAVKGISPRPLLLLAGDSDDSVPPDHAHKIFAAAREPKKMSFFEGNGHEDNGTAKIFAETILPFLEEHFGPPIAPEEEDMEEEEPVDTIDTEEIAIA